MQRRHLPISVLSSGRPARGRGGRFAFWLLGLCLAAWALPAAGQAQERRSPDALEAKLEERVRAQPTDGAGWRLLGRVRWRRGELASAQEAFLQAVTLDPQSAAAHFDLGRLLLAQNQPDAAGQHLLQTCQLAPDSDYAREARVQLQQLPNPPADPNVVPARYELKGFDNPVAEPEAESAGAPKPSRPYAIRLDAGAVYNSNVTLNPLSTDLFFRSHAGAQGFLAPHLEYGQALGEVWRGGAFFDGDFNLNEGPFHVFNLQHYQPGVYVQRPLTWAAVEWVPRLQYDFTYDAFEGRTFGTRHGVTLSLDTKWNSSQSSLVYGRVDSTDFQDDGPVPSITSQDGWTYTTGVSHALAPGLAHLSLLRCGADLQWADLAGSNFSYRGLYVYGEADVPLAYQAVLIVQGGWGYRQYPDFEFTPSRDGPIWRASVELRKTFNEHWSASGTFSYDLFDAQNDVFKADRLLGGMFVTYRY